MLVADSENDRVVEYARTDNPENGSEWELIWELSSGFNWPRDADRLPNGNTLVTDTLNHRVVEVTPTGKVVWEYYAPWAPYDSERLSAAGRNETDRIVAANGSTASVGGSHGPTMIDLNTTGGYNLSGSAENGPADRMKFSTWVASVTAGTPIGETVDFTAERYSHAVPFIKPVWLSSWAFAALLGAVLVALPWGIGEGIYQRKRVRRIAGQVRKKLSL